MEEEQDDEKEEEKEEDEEDIGAQMGIIVVHLAKK